MLAIVFLTGCAGVSQAFRTKLETPPEFNQKVQLLVDDDYQMFQAPRSSYDVGDLQSFHTQHTLGLRVEEAFKEVFGEVEFIDDEAKIETGDPEVPAVFEVKIADLAHDIYNESSSYRSQIHLAVAMKSPRGEIFWQKVFRGEGYALVDPQYGSQLGPEQAVLDAMRDALNQMQDALIHSPQVRLQMKHYLEIDQARKQKDAAA